MKSLYDGINKQARENNKTHAIVTTPTNDIITETNKMNPIIVGLCVEAVIINIILLILLIRMITRRRKKPERLQ